MDKFAPLTTDESQQKSNDWIKNEIENATQKETNFVTYGCNLQVKLLKICTGDKGM